MTLSPQHPLLVSHCCCPLLLSILQANRTFSHSFSTFPLGSAFPRLSHVTNSRMCPSTVSDHLTVPGALPDAAGPCDMQVTECPQTLLCPHRAHGTVHLPWPLLSRSNLLSEPEGRRRHNEGISTQVFCSCAAGFKGNPQALSAE